MKGGRARAWLRFCVPMGAAWTLCVSGAFYWAMRNGILGPYHWYDTPVLLALLFAVPAATAAWSWRRNWGLKRRLLLSFRTFLLASMTEFVSAFACWILLSALAAAIVASMA